MTPLSSCRPVFAAVLLLCASYTGAAEGDPDASTVVIKASRTSQLGVAESANSGVVTQAQLEARTKVYEAELAAFEAHQSATKATMKKAAASKSNVGNLSL